MVGHIICYVGSDVHFYPEEVLQKQSSQVEIKIIQVKPVLKPNIGAVYMKPVSLARI